MTDEMNAEFIADIEAIKKSGLLAEAVEHVEGLEALWPLDNPEYVDNDVKYGEELQVRVTRQIANHLSDDDVTIPDAEFFYEAGVETIAGRPETVVKALSAATDAYEMFRDAGEERDFSEAALVFDILGIPCDRLTGNDEEFSFKGVLTRALAVSEGLADCSTGNSIEDSLALIYAVIHSISSLCVKHSVLLIPLAVTALSTAFGLPQIYVSDELLAQIANIQSNANSQELVLRSFAQSVVDEADRHKSDVEWDTTQAKRIAREEDEAKNKAALAEKFENAPNTDAQKEHIEL